MTVNITREPHVTKAVINRPETRNAINFDVMDQLESLLDDLEKDPEIRLFILTGTGKSFISGGDLREFHSIEDAEGARQMSERMIRILNRIKQLPFWTLAAVNGAAYGGGWETMLAFDFRVATSSATFGFTQGKFYLPPGWGGISALTRAVGLPMAKYWLASQKVIDSDTALQAGLIQEVFRDDQFENQLNSLSETLIKNDRAFIEYIKHSGSYANTEEEIEPFSRFWESEEHQNRVNEFLQSRPST